MRALLLPLCCLALACTRWPATSAALPVGAVQVADAGGTTCQPSCANWKNPVVVGTLSVPGLNELSGLAASRRQPGIFYAHNDSGDLARFFVLDGAGTPLAELHLDAGANRDWEDVALGPCDGGDCLYFADVGDNRLVRDDYAVYRVPEPLAATGLGAAPFERIAVRYPNGDRHNAETLLADPTSGRLYLVSKEVTGSASSVFRFPEVLDPSSVAQLELVRVLPFPTAVDAPVTGGDVHPCGRSVLLRMYNRLFELHRPDGGAFEDVFSATPTEVPFGAEPQGEAVAYTADGRGYLTASEFLVDSVSMYRVDCR